MSSNDDTPPLAITGARSVRRDGREAVDVGPFEHAVAGDVGDHERARRREPTQRLVERHAGALGPAVHRDLAVAVIETDCHVDHLAPQRRPAPDAGPPPSPSRPEPHRRRPTAERRPPCEPHRRSAPALARPPRRRWRRRPGDSRGEPDRAASRSTTWIHVAPASANERATATGSLPYTLALP